MEKKQHGKRVSTAGNRAEKHSIFGIFKNISPAGKVMLRNILGVSCIILITVFFFMQGVDRMKENYHTRKQNVYDSFQETAFAIAEAQNHVSNDVIISIEGVQEISRLEVLAVSGSAYVIKNANEDDKTTSWLEVQGTGVFTVDLSAGEFIADSERQHVLVWIPKPMLTECKVSGTGKLFWRNGALFSNGSIAEGVRLSQKQLGEGRLKLEDSMKQNRLFHESAQRAAISIIESLVRQWNPNIPDLQVTVESIDNF